MKLVAWAMAYPPAVGDRADEFLKSCHFKAQAQGLNPNYFVAEFVKSMVEINTPPADTRVGCLSACPSYQLLLQNLYKTDRNLN